MEVHSDIESFLRSSLDAKNLEIQQILQKALNTYLLRCPFNAIFQFFLMTAYLLFIKIHLKTAWQPSCHNIGSVMKTEDDCYSLGKYWYLKLFSALFASLNLFSDL